MKGGALLAALVVAAAASLLARPPSRLPSAPALAAAATAPAPASLHARAASKVQAAGPGWFGDLPQAAVVPAADSMADARLHGDARTPPLVRTAAPAAGPNAAQLADPQAYRAYQAGQDARVMAAFASAAQREVPRLQADVERARASGIPADQIAKVEEKIRRLEQLRRDVAEPGASPPH